MTQTTIARVVPLHVQTIAAENGDARKARYRACVAFKPAPGGWLVGAPKGRKPGEEPWIPAVRDLERKLREFGSPIPQWDVRVAAPQPAAQPVEPAPEPEDEIDPPTLRMAPVSSRDEVLADAAEAAIEQAKAEILPPVIAGGMPAGAITPAGGANALAFWVSVYRQAVAKFVDLEWPGENPREKLVNFRTAVDTCLRDKSCVGAWDRDIAGNCWVRHAQSFDRTVVDPTVKLPQPGKPGREWDLSPRNAPRLASTKVKPEKPTRKAVETVAGESASYQGSRDAWKVAQKYGNMLGDHAQQIGQRRGLAFKVGVVVSLRAQEALGFPRYEREITEAGVTPEYLASAVAAYRTAAK